jgi:hypothetical protein
MANQTPTKPRQRRHVSVVDKKAVAKKRADDWLPAALEHLAQRRGPAALADCPLPELYRIAQQSTPGLTIGQFHDGIRHLYDRQEIYLHPWTGPLFELPEPTVALMVGHEIAYYASLRTT